MNQPHDLLIRMRTWDCLGNHSLLESVPHCRAAMQIDEACVLLRVRSWGKGVADAEH